ncbi:Type III restriction enzyme, res subunit/SNF2 family N-terminal domain/Helicase conserved C-terminal domain containing protein, putative [Angomonas deanei]|uniref:Type III restriction enzyme, res subunit/SNF2 family N-terminal domain/Helicase conserved C-terminal domain containing protein, putative n=1 Tax=Angomonas deanei TaxID=59799 RepID=A0A7G2C1C0_9TRYP|nr:Type III restriction enzyme, res subunit/SNF2 family N-terminal domain/Helicase conserved C-terminal domain containing protein, putative [Angomonas deanei]
MPSQKRERENSVVDEIPDGSAPDVGVPQISNADLDAIVNLMYYKKVKYETTSFCSAPPAVLPIWQRIALSAVHHAAAHADEIRASARPLGLFTQQLKAYHNEIHEREERIRGEQHSARQRNGLWLSNAVSSYWNKRGDLFQQLIKVEFDVAKKKYDARKQEDMLAETEALTKKLLDSIITKGADESDELELKLSLLDTQDGKRPLRSYQRSALKWMIHLFENNLNGILADEMGLGKTVQTIALLCYFAEYRNDWGPHLIVVPTTVVLNWKAEFQRWAPGLKVVTYIGTFKERKALRKGWSAEDAFHVCVTSYNLVVNDRHVFRRRPWGFLVLDEAHQVKNFMSKKWQSLFDLQAQYRLLLTGTPLQNSMMELWSLFHFLLPFASAFKSNDDFKEWFSNPLDEMITGRASLNEDIVRRLQSLIRPFMLRRLKKDVEWQLPSKTEKVVLCQLSRRQRFLYDEYMQLAETKQRIAKGGAGGVLGVLLALRKVCDHPDLFQEHPTLSPFVLGWDSRISVEVPRQVLLRNNCFNFRRQDSLVDVDHSACFDVFPCTYTSLQFDNSGYSGLHSKASLLQRLAPELLILRTGTTKGKSSSPRVPEDIRSFCDGLIQSHQVNVRDRHQLCARIQAQRVVRESASIDVFFSDALRFPLRDSILKQRFPFLCPSITDRLRTAMPVLQKFMTYLPAAIVSAPPSLRCRLPVLHFSGFRNLDYVSLAGFIGYIKKKQESLKDGREKCSNRYEASDFLKELWPIHVHRSFSFPDRRLIIYDCGKLQFLKDALVQLKKDGHRMLIFTQFTVMLNILEKFLAIIGVAYLRLDGSTRAELRQQYVDRFNEDTRISCMILSTRSGGIGLNLTGADTVIFYDSDWNPTMDLQAQDRCHRIGQTRAVTIYRLISAYTVEESILEKARERKRLNNLVIRGGQFHAIAGVDTSFEDSSSAYAALAAPVNLRSFFHDLDEDATVDDAAAHTTEGEMILTMRDVEDDEDRLAQMQVEEELQERERDDIREGDQYETEMSPNPDEEVEGVVMEHVLLPRAGADDSVADSMRDDDEKVIRATRARQKVALKPFSPVDQVVTLRYGVCHPSDAEERYNDVLEKFADQMEDEHATLPPFRPEL